MKQMLIVQNHQSIRRKFTILCPLYKEIFSCFDTTTGKGQDAEKQGEWHESGQKKLIRKYQIKTIKFTIKLLTIVIKKMNNTPKKIQSSWDVLQKS